MITEIQQKFIDNLLQTNSLEESAIKAGVKRDEALTAGINMLANEEVREAFQKRQKEYESAVNVLSLTKERLLGIMLFQYEKANRFNKTKEAVDILSQIAEAQGINMKELKMDPVILNVYNCEMDKI